jgi:predicted transglutaminase-like cysteine proteinase
MKGRMVLTVVAMAFAVGCDEADEEDWKHEGPRSVGEGETGNACFTESFADYPMADWTEGSRHGHWQVTFTGYGRVSIERDDTRNGNVLTLCPNEPSMDETHSALVTMEEVMGAFELTVEVATVRQLRQGSPNPWEVGWLLWHFTDNTHFYYFLLKPNGWELGKADPAFPGAQRFLATGSNPALTPGEYQRITVVQIGPLMKVWVDGRHVVSFEDEERPYLSGRIGLYTEDALVRFGDLELTTVGTESSPAGADGLTTREIPVGIDVASPEWKVRASRPREDAGGESWESVLENKGLDVARICSTIRARIKYEPDLYADEEWRSGRETWERRAGDCEDFAVVACAVLRANGFTANIYVLWTTARRQGHAVVIGHDEAGRHFVVSNGSLEWVENEDEARRLSADRLGWGRSSTHMRRKEM